MSTNFNDQMVVLSQFIATADAILQAEVNVYASRYELEQIEKLSKEESEMLEALEEYHGYAPIQIVREKLLHALKFRRSWSKSLLSNGDENAG